MERWASGRVLNEKNSIPCARLPTLQRSLKIHQLYHPEKEWYLGGENQVILA